MTPEDFDRERQSRTSAIQERAEELLKTECKVEYRVYETDADGLPVDNLDKVAVEGRCRFVQKHEPFRGMDLTTRAPSSSVPRGNRSPSWPAPGSSRPATSTTPSWKASRS
jgi:hypothetical protein